MTTSKFKPGDKVTILSNTLQPQYQGQIGRIKKVFPTFSDDDVRRYCYRVEVKGEVLKGIAMETDLSFINSLD